MDNQPGSRPGADHKVHAPEVRLARAKSPILQHPEPNHPTPQPVPLRPTQSVSFFESNNQERLRRFTILAHPSLANVTTADQPPQRNPSVSRKSSAQGNLPARTPSRQGLASHDILLFVTSREHGKSVQPGTSHAFFGSNDSSRVSSPTIDPHFKGDTLADRALTTPLPPPARPELVVSPSDSSRSQPIRINSGTSSASVSRKGSLSTKKNQKTVVASPVGPPVPFQQYLTKEDDGKFHILLACTGSVATIKVPLIIDKLLLYYGQKVLIQLVVTKSAEHFLKGLKINSDVKIWRDEDEWANYIETTQTTTASTETHPKKPKNPYEKLILHNELRKWADIMLIAPLSANTLAKIANGICDNLLTSIIRSWGPSTGKAQGEVAVKPILVAPAMNTFMYTHPITARQLQEVSLAAFGLEVLKPVEKVLVCGDIGMGGMREWTDIVEIVRRKIAVMKAERVQEQIDEANEEDEDEEGDNDDDEEEDEEEDDEEDDDEEDDDDDDHDTNEDKEEKVMMFDIETTPATNII